METNNQSFWQFSDQLRLQSSNLSNLSLNDSIWSLNSSPASKKPDRRNFDIRVGGHLPTPDSNTNTNELNQMWKLGSSFGSGQGINLNGGFNKGVYSNPSNNINTANDQCYKNIGFKGEDEYLNNEGTNINNRGRKKNNEVKKENNINGEKENKIGSDSNNKRFKTLPPSEALPRNETVGGYIFVCNNDTMEENIRRQLFGLPPRYRDSVRQITPGLPLFLYNYSTHQLHGIYEAASFGGTNIDPTAWEDKKNPSESRFPAQVKVQTRKVCEPLDEDAFRPILHHYDGPKFRLELSVPEALSLLDIFAEDDA